MVEVLSEVNVGKILEPVVRTLKKKDPKHWNAFNSAEYFIEPTPGDLIIFPSTINHWVEPNPSKNDRISLAFNWSIE